VSERSFARRDMLRISAAVGVSAAFGGGVAAGLLRQAGIHSVRQTRPRMGTIVTISVAHPDVEGARAMVEDAFSEMERLESVLTRHRLTAPLGELNATGRVAYAPEELRYVLTAALGLAERSGGAFDPTVLPVLKEWESARSAGMARPADLAVEHARAHVGFGGVRFREEGIALDDRRMAVTLDGIAKGFVVDRTLEGLVSAGADRVLVDAGGDMASGGDASKSDPWTVAIQDPQVDASEGLVRLAGGCIATSGDYLHSFSEDRSDHHIIDPRTGRSPDATSAVSVLAGRAMDADGLSTTLLVMGPDSGMVLVDGTPGAEALIIDKQGARMQSQGFAITRA